MKRCNAKQFVELVVQYNGDASQDNQKQAVPLLVTRFFKEANYLPSYIPRIIDLVICHHDYDDIKNKLLQLLIEADLIVNCYGTRPDRKKQNISKGFSKLMEGKSCWHFV